MNAWLTYDEKETKKVMDFANQYMEFISSAKTERLAVKEIIKIAEQNGYKDIQDVLKENVILKPQDKVYCNMMNKSVALIHLGNDDLKDGMNILGSHLDSPRLDLKQKPLYEKDEIALMDTHYYGGIKKYQWVMTPLALVGVVFFKEGTTNDV